MPEPRFVLNVNPGRLDVVHHNPREECNTDDAKGRLNIDPDTAEALVKTRQARWCGHCARHLDTEEEEHL